MAKVIKKQMSILRIANHLEQIPTKPPLRRHQLQGKRKEYFAIDLVHPHRLIFRINQNPLPRKSDKGIDLKQIDMIEIVEVVDYH